LLNRFLLFVGLICCLVASELQAQRWALSATSGINLYKGDVSDWKLLPNLNQLKVISTAVKFNVRYQRTQAFAYRGQVSFGRISGAGMNNPGPISSLKSAFFTSPLVEMSGIVDYNFLDYQTDRKVKNWSPYIYGGVSYMFASPKGSVGSATPFFTWAIPYGVGIKYQLTPRLGLQWEFGSSKTFSDMLDNTPSLGGSDSNFTTQRTDQVLQSSISVTYVIKSVFCPRE
jgi:hypothetical protein